MKGPQSEALLAFLLISSEGAKMRPGSLSIMMSALKVVESSPTTRPIGGKAPVAKASLVQVSSSSSGSDDHDIRPVSTPHDASKSLHIAEEKMQVAPSEIGLSSKEIATVEDIFYFPPISFLIEDIDDILIICLSNILQGLPLPLKVKPPQTSKR